MADDGGNDDGVAVAEAVAVEGPADDKPTKVEIATPTGDEQDWKAYSRKWERKAKGLQEELDKVQAANKSEQEKALEAARQEGEKAASSRYEALIRGDRLEASVIRLATKGVKVGEEIVRFTDPEDAFVHVDHAIKIGKIDAADLFDDDGRVTTESLSAVLAEVLQQKKHLAATRPTRITGTADAGRGTASSKSLEDLSVEEHFNRIRRTK